MAYYTFFGINEFIVCLGFKGDIIRNYFANYQLLNSDCTIDYSKNLDRLIIGGFMVFDKKLLSYLKKDEQCDFESDILKTLATNNQIASYKHLGNWM